MKEHAQIKTRLGFSFPINVNPLTAQGWKVVSIDCRRESIAGRTISYANVFLERDKKEHTDGQDNTH